MSDENITFTKEEAFNLANQWQTPEYRPKVDADTYSALCGAVEQALVKGGYAVPFWIDPQSKATAVEPDSSTYGRMKRAMM